MLAPPSRLTEFIRAHSRNPCLDFTPMSKVYSNATAALDGLLHDNMTIAAGGVGLCGTTGNLTSALRLSGVRRLPDARHKAREGECAMGGVDPTRQRENEQ